jgi:hypothetical protein
MTQSSNPQAWDFLVRRSDLHDHTTRAADPAVVDAPLADHELVLRVEALALTSNTLTYAVTGERLGYWRFYPAPDGWGRIPAWGFTEVIRSAAPEIAVGERLFGYVPMSTHARLVASRIRPDSVIDATPHRAQLPAAYNFYRRAGTSAAPLTDDDALLAVVRPLFFTSFLIDDQIAERAWDAAGSIVLSSASSKTAFGTAFQLHARRPAARIVGLTSPRNRAFVERLATYDTLLDYTDLAAIAALPAPVTFIDFAGNADFAAQLTTALGSHLTTSLRVGATHWTAVGPGPTGGPARETFFAPDRIAQRTQLWSAAGLHARVATAWDHFLPFARRHLRIDLATGPAALADRYTTITAGHLDPDVACLVVP